MYDPEVPAGYQDADIEMAMLAEASGDEPEWPSCGSMYGPVECESDVVNQGLCGPHDREWQRYRAGGDEPSW